MADGFVCFSGQDWWYHGRAHADFQLMRNLGRTSPTLVVNSIGMRMPSPGRTDKAVTRVVRKLASTVRFLRRPLPDEAPGLWVMTPVSVPLFGHRLLRQANAWVVAVQVRLVARFVLGLRRPWVVVVVPTALDVVERLGWQDRMLYYRADNHAAAVDVDRALIRSFEDRLIERSRLVLYSSASLLASERARVGAKGQVLDHGVDLDRFTLTSGPEPADLAVVPHPRVGFFGAVDGTVVDLDLLDRLATELAPAQLVLVGRVDSDLGPLARRPNVHVLGQRPYEEVPAYGAGFDVAICPFVDDEWVRSSNPIKLKEYLALGLPVVSVPIPDLARYGQVVAFAEGPDDFVAAVHKALDHGEPGTSEARRAAVADDGWDERARTIERWCRALDEGVPVP